MPVNVAKVIVYVEGAPMNYLLLILAGVTVVSSIACSGITQEELQLALDEQAAAAEKQVERAAQDLAAAAARNDELSVTNTVLTDDLSAAAARNDELSAINTGLTDDLAAAAARNEELSAINTGLTDDLAAATARNDELSVTNTGLTDDLAAATARNDELSVTNTGLTDDLAAATARNDELSAINVATASRIQVLDEELKSMVGRLAEVDGKLTAVNVKYNNLVRVTGGLADTTAQLSVLEAEAEQLRDDIKQLQEDRKPLLVDTHIDGLRCTGSMEPTLTCLDTITLLSNFYAADITVGTIIVFESDPECFELDSIIHRVVDIKTVSGQLHFQTKGDNVPYVDKCWVPAENVEGYAVAVQKNTRPQNERLRSIVNVSHGEMVTAEASLEAARTKYDAAAQKYCMGSDPCLVGPTELPEMKRLYAEYVSLYNSYSRALEYYQCWLKSARTAYYLGEGLLYPSCVRPLLMDIPTLAPDTR